MEMVINLANWSLALGEVLEPHRLEQHANPTPATEVGDVASSLAPQEYASLPMSLVDVHVDDIIGAAEGDAQQHLQVTCAILHSVDKVFQPLEPTNLPECQEPVSLKKLDKGDRRMSTKKMVLGWDIDIQGLTMHLTKRCHQHLLDILNDIPWTRKSISVNTWHKVLGELQSMSLALPGVGACAVPYKFASSLRKNVSIQQ